MMRRGEDHCRELRSIERGALGRRRAENHVAEAIKQAQSKKSSEVDTLSLMVASQQRMFEMEMQLIDQQVAARIKADEVTKAAKVRGAAVFDKTWDDPFWQGDWT